MKKVLCFIIAVILVSTLFVACGNDTTETSSEPASESKAETSSAVSEEASEPVSDGPKIYGEDLEVVDLDGFTLRVLTSDWANSSITYNGEIIQRDDYDETAADALDIAKYEARQAIMKKYNCNIEGHFVAQNENINTIVQNQVMDGSDTPYHIVFTGLVNAATMATNGLYVDLFSIPSLNELQDEWWDANSVKDLALANKLYFVNGDINTFDNDGTFIMFYNKQLLNETNPGVDVYELVNNKEWTLDTFYELMSNATYESDGVDGMTELDNWGFGTETYNVYLMLIASGNKIAKLDGDGMPTLTYRTESFSNALTKIYELYEDDKVMVANDGRFDSRGFTSVWEETTIKAFREGRELFYMGGIFNFTNFREIDFKYGFLPVPLYSEDQDEYYHFVSAGNSSCMGIPASFDDDVLNDVGLLVQALGAESKNNVTPVYYDKCLKGKDADTEADEKMLDIIFNSRTYDIGSIFNWGGIVSVITKISSSDMTHRFEEIADVVDDAMNDTVDILLALEY